MSLLARVSWAAFAVSAVAATLLCVVRVCERRGAPAAGVPSGDARTVAGEPADVGPRGDEGTEKLAAQAASLPDEPDRAAGIDALIAAAELAAQAARTATPVVRPEPEAFMRSLVDMIKKGDMDNFAPRLRPGAARLAQGVLMMMLMAKVGKKNDELERGLDGATFEFEELPDGLVRVHMKDGYGHGPPEPVYLVPGEGMWDVATESDLSAPAVDLQAALNRLRLLAVCQHTYLLEDSGEGRGYAESVRELAEGLNRSPVYEGALSAELADAVDLGTPTGGYIFGKVASGGKEFAYSARPVQYGEGSKETLLIDGEGRVWAKDLQGEPPPAAWPGPNPEKLGWQRKGDARR